jgi:hypothetical protein
MRYAFLLIIGLAGLKAFSQIIPDSKVQVQDRKILERNPPFTLNDSIIDVVYTNKQIGHETTACFIDSFLVDFNTVLWINPSAIREVKIHRKDTIISGKVYENQLFVKIHDSLKVNLMSLSEIRRKYTRPSANKAIFVLKNRLNKNEEIIMNNQESMVDRNYVFRIVVDQLDFRDQNQKDSTLVDVIRILFHTQENIDEANKIMIRGSDTP